MNCTKCETLIIEGSAKCESCGAATTFIKKDIFTYDYKTIESNQKNAMEIVDCYGALGWELANKNDNYISSGVALNFRRNRKIKNKDQLNRLQVKLDDSLNGIGVMERHKTQKAFIVSLILGLTGILTFGGGMCICLLLPYSQIISYIVGSLIAAVGVAIAAPAYPAYKKISVKAAAAMNILIDKKKDEISRLCEDAQSLLA